MLADHPGVVAAYLFGSTATGSATPSSDVDIGVLFSTTMPLDDLIQLESDLGEAIRRTVDLVDVKRAGAFLALDVIRGDRFFCRDEVGTDEFDLYVLSRAGDLEFYERERRAYFLDSQVADGGA